jgi:hypothetical protein
MKQPNDMKGEEMSDDELVEAVIECRDKDKVEEADSLAATLLVDRYGALIETLAKKYCNDPVKEMSPLTEIFLHLRTEWTQKDDVDGRPWDYLSNYDPSGGAFKSYLSMVVKKYYLGGSDRQYVRASQQDPTDSPDEHLYGTSDGKRKIDQKTEGKDLRDKVIAEIEKSSHYFEGAIQALKMRYHGFVYTEIRSEIEAERNSGALKAQVHRLRDDVRDRIPDRHRPDWL